MAVSLSTAFAHGAAADRPTASATIEGQFYFSEDTGDFSQVQGGAWVTVAASGLRVVTVEISNTELLALHTTPKTLVPTPDAGKRNVPFFVYCIYSGGTPYTHPSGTIMTFANGDLSFSYGQIAWDSLGLNQADPLEGTGYLAINPQTVQAMVRNQPIVAALTDPAGLADGDGTLTLAVVYLVV